MSYLSFLFSLVFSFSVHAQNFQPETLGYLLRTNKSVAMKVGTLEGEGLVVFPGETQLKICDFISIQYKKPAEVLTWYSNVVEFNITSIDEDYNSYTYYFKIGSHDDIKNVVVLGNAMFMKFENLKEYCPDVNFIVIK